MPLAAAPVLASLIGAGGSVAGALLGRKSAGNVQTGGPYADIAQRPDFQAAAGRQGDIANSLMGTAGGYNNLAMPSLEAAQKFWMPILSGDVNATGQFLAPEISGLGNQYATARRNIANFTPSGGGRDTALGQSYYQQAGDVGRLIAGARPAAAAGLLNLGGTAGTLGSYAGQAASGANATLLDALLGGGRLGLGQQQVNLGIGQQQGGFGSAIGSGLGSLATSIYDLIRGQQSGKSIAGVAPGTPSQFLQNYPSVSGIPNSPNILF